MDNANAPRRWVAFPDTPIGAPVRAERALRFSVFVSGIRCIFAYVVLPFLTPLVGMAPGVGPSLGIAIGIVAIGANTISLRRFRRLRHRWLKGVTVLHVGVICLLLVLIAVDVAELVR